MDIKTSLDRFLTVQEYDYKYALKEIREGCKRTHWIWYIFPQMVGLGSSYYSNIYGIRSLEEAKEYLSHEVLGERLREITQVLLSLEGLTALDILGETDAMKVRSCMTLFDAVSPDDIFNDILVKYYAGKRCHRTLSILGLE